MAKFCGKCGTRSDETTGLCPNCDAKKSKEKKYQKEIINRKKKILKLKIIFRNSDFNNSNWWCIPVRVFWHC